MICVYCEKEKEVEDYCGKKACDECKNDKIAFAQENFFDNKGKFYPARLGQELLKRHDFVSPDGERLFEYHAELGIYLESEAHARQQIQEMLGELNSRNYSAETLFFLKNQTLNTERTKTPPPNLIPFKNVIYDLATNETKPYSQEHFFTSKLNAEYDSHLHQCYGDGSACPAIHQFLGEIMNEENREVFLQFAGYCLYRDYPISKALMLVGSGNNGKSTALTVLEEMLGKENISSVELQDLSENRFAASQLLGKHANILADLSKTSLSETGRFKMLTGGDTLNAEFKFKNPVPFRNYAKLVFSANTVPLSKDETDAFFRRWIIVNFERQFTEQTEIPKPAMLAKLTPANELCGLAMEGLKRLPRLLELGAFNTTRDMQKMKEDYIRASDPVGAFIMDCVVEQDGAATSKDELYRAYVIYCLEKQLQTRDKLSFGKIVSAKRGWRSSQREVAGVKNVHVWVDVTLIDAKKEVEAKEPTESFDEQQKL